MFSEKNMDNKPTIKPERLTRFIELMQQTETLKFLSDFKKHFQDAGIYLVGGIVRDKLQGKKSKDIDFIITKIKADNLVEFLSQFGHIELVGASFGVFKFMPKNAKLSEAIDIALPRTETAGGSGGYRDFDIQSNPNLSVEDDLSRRDLTINAMAFDIKNNKLIDPFNGQQDLESGIIRAVGDPKQRFTEDYSRILRAIRFAVKLSFEIEEKTWDAIKEDAPKILNKQNVLGQQKEIVPYETIFKELAKSLKANPVKTLELYDQSNLLKIIFPEIEACKGVAQPKEFHEEGDVFEHNKLVLENLPPDASLRLRLAALFHDVGKFKTTKTPKEHGVDRIRSDEHAEEGAKITQKICQRLKLPAQLTEEIIWLVQYHMFFVSGKVEDMRPNTIKKYFIDNPKLGDELLELYYIDTKASLGPTQTQNLARIKEVREYINKMRAQFKKSEIKTFRHVINGQDIMKEFKIKPSKEVGEYLEKADKFILEYITKNGKEPEKKEVINYLGY